MSTLAGFRPFPIYLSILGKIRVVPKTPTWNFPVEVLLKRESLFRMHLVNHGILLLQIPIALVVPKYILNGLIL